ncbi:hypothetical protein M231_04842 [Tremella mesenterica]|uniref:Uncharacterized protein n=1 Tax=Tremella mesenterica TaxID=5217 RepID=A0A4Q1BJG3_TREME|nr:hypothetical protein M231_04842 [Tremella mesenterica]
MFSLVALLVLINFCHGLAWPFDSRAKAPKCKYDPDCPPDQHCVHQPNGDHRCGPEGIGCVFDQDCPGGYCFQEICTITGPAITTITVAPPPGETFRGSCNTEKDCRPDGYCDLVNDECIYPISTIITSIVHVTSSHHPTITSIKGHSGSFSTSKSSLTFPKSISPTFHPSSHKSIHARAHNSPSRASSATSAVPTCPPVDFSALQANLGQLDDYVYELLLDAQQLDQDLGNRTHHTRDMVDRVIRPATEEKRNIQERQGPYPYCPIVDSTEVFSLVGQIQRDLNLLAAAIHDAQKTAKKCGKRT